jgi:hypothetical protein
MQIPSIEKESLRLHSRIDFGILALCAALPGTAESGPLSSSFEAWMTLGQADMT